ARFMCAHVEVAALIPDERLHALVVVLAEAGAGLEHTRLTVVASAGRPALVQKAVSCDRAAARAEQTFAVPTAIDILARPATHVARHRMAITDDRADLITAPSRRPEAPITSAAHQ